MIERILQKDQIRLIREYIAWKSVIDNMVFQMYHIPKDIIIDEKIMSKTLFELKYFRKRKISKEEEYGKRN
jgi:hypothetical protein